MSVKITLPRVLHDAVGASSVRVQAASLRQAFEEAYRKIPALRFQLCVDDGTFRAHVLCFLNGENMHSLDVPVRDGDEISILQAVSGG